jgi:lysophospholipase L1-like esterase
MGKPRSQILVNSTLLVLSLLIAGLLLEGGLRVYAALLFPKMMVLDDTIGWRHATNVSRTFQNEFGEKVLVMQDSYGHRGKGHSLQKTAGRFRILALGDSFTEAVQVDEQEVFTARLEKADPRFDVINAGVGGYGTVQEYLYLLSQGLQFRPDLVLLMFFENDLTDNVLTYYPGFGPRPYARLSGGTVQLTESLDGSDYKKFILPVPFRMALNRYSYFYYFANSRIYQPMFADRMRRLQQADLRSIDGSTQYQVFYAVLDKLRELCEKEHIPLLAVLIPTRDDVANGHSDVAEMINEHCQHEKINCLPLIDRFTKEASAAAPLYFRNDIHWTREGHRVAADEVLKNLQPPRAGFDRLGSNLWEKALR